MRRLTLLVILALVGLSAPATWASGPTHTKSTFPYEFLSPAGTFCDFDELSTGTIVDNVLVFGDPDDPTRVIVNETQINTHTNLETGATLTEVDHFVIQFDATDAQVKQEGLFWHLRTPDGKPVVVQAGLITFDTNTGEILKVTPQINPNNAEVLCPALGGQAAI